MTKVDVLVSFLSIRRSGNGTGLAASLKRALMEIHTDWPHDLSKAFDSYRGRRLAHGPAVETDASATNGCATRWPASIPSALTTDARHGAMDAAPD